MRRNDPASADDAGRRPHRGPGNRDLRAADGCLQTRARFCRLARACPSATLDRRQTGSREDLKDGPARYSPPADHRRDDRRPLGLRKGAPEGSWLQRMLARKPKMLVAIALANKMARSAWAMLAKEDFRVPTVAAI